MQKMKTKERKKMQMTHFHYEHIENNKRDFVVAKILSLTHTQTQTHSQTDIYSLAKCTQSEVNE